MKKTMPHAPGNGIGKVTPEGWHTRTDAAKLVGKSYDTIRRWDRANIYKPTGSMNVGLLEVWLYSDDDIKAMKKIARHIKPGFEAKKTNVIGIPSKERL